jgi:hypothetical protein
MLFSFQGREGIGLVNNLAGIRRGGKSKKFMDAIRRLVLQKAISGMRVRQMLETEDPKMVLRRAGPWSKPSQWLSLLR